MTGRKQGLGFHHKVNGLNLLAPPAGKGLKAGADAGLMGLSQRLGASHLESDLVALLAQVPLALDLAPNQNQSRNLAGFVPNGVILVLIY